MSILRRSNDFFPGFFDGFGKDFFDDFTPSSSNQTLPAVNIVDNKDNYRIEVAAPGMKKEDFKVNMDGNILSVFSEKETKNEQYARKEFSYSSFKRTFTLPEGIEPNEINASYKDGILAVEIPKKDDVRKRETKQISIR